MGIMEIVDIATHLAVSVVAPSVLGVKDESFISVIFYEIEIFKYCFQNC